MEVGRRTTTRNCAVAGSVWESGMKTDEVKGGIKVFNGGEESPEENGDKRLRPKQSPLGVSGKRKTWKSENSEGSERKNPIPIARQRSEQTKNLDEQCKALSVSADGIKRSPIQSKKTRSKEAKELSGSVDRIERNPIQIRKVKSESQNFTEKNPIQLRKVKSESNKAADGNEKNPIQLRKAKSVTNEALDDSGKNSDGLGAIEPKKVKPESPNVAVDESAKGLDGAVETIEKNPVGTEESESEETCKEFGVCEEKVISSSLSNVGQAKSAPELVAPDDDGDEEEDWDEELDEEMDEEIEVEIEKCFDVKEINIPEQQKPEQVVIEEKMLHQIQEKPLPIAPIVKKQAPPSVSHSRTPPTPTKTKPTPISHGFQRSETHAKFQRNPETHNKLQSLVDLVMWKDVSKSAFVFGVGTFIIMSSSYAKDLNISLITVVSYLGLIYLGAIFLFRSIINRGTIEIDETRQDSVVGEEEAVWLLKMVLPYLNEFLLKLRALFSGDPGTTMKLAVLLFVLARCGSSITVWKLAKFGFFGAFTVPKICSSYSSQFTAYGKFWVRRFQDAWQSCSHKKAVAFGIFTLAWNLCSVEARVWAAFMLFVAFRYYHQSVMRDDWVEQKAECETSWQEQIGGQKGRRGPTRMETKDEKKRF